jgi:hypothetical protein
MKTILTFLMPLIAVITSVASFKFFADASYYMSALLTVVAYLSASVSVYLFTNNRKAITH